MTKTWTMRQLRQELRGFESALKAAGHRDSSIQTYVGRSETFLRWLDGDYSPRQGNAASRSSWSRPGRTKRSVARVERSHGTPGRLDIVSQVAVAPFDFRWPNSVERFERGWDLEVSTAGRVHRVRHAITARAAFGRKRVRSVTWVDGAVAVEGVETDSHGTDRTLVSLLRINGRQHVKAPGEVPGGYQSFDIVRFDSVVTGTGVFKGYAVRIREDDLAMWARHALLRHRSKSR